jgi:hypothetical protein
MGCNSKDVSIAEFNNVDEVEKKKLTLFKHFMCGENNLCKTMCFYLQDKEVFILCRLYLDFSNKYKT